MSSRKKIGIIFGGLSSEVEVSLMGGRNVYQNINQTKYEPIAIYWDKQSRFWIIPETLVIRNTTKEIEKRLEKFAEQIEYEQLKSKIDLALLITHGKYGDDGCLQGLLELLNVPYTGSGVLSSSLGLDKAMQRKLIKAYGGVNQPDYLVFSKSQWLKEKEKVIKEIEEKFSYPITSKPTREGSTFGVTVIKSRGELDQAFNQAFKFDNYVLIEEYIKGREFSCVVYGNDNPVALPPTECLHKGEIFTYDDKYLPGASNKITPMEIDWKIIKDIQDQVVKTFKALRCKGYARIDGFVTEDNKVLITDPNSAASTGLGPSSWTWHQAAAADMSVAQFIDKIIELGFEAHKNKRGPL